MPTKTSVSACSFLKNRADEAATAGSLRLRSFFWTSLAVIELPPTWQSPHPWRHQFHRVTGRVTKVKGLTPSRPLNFFFDGDAVAVQELPPGVEGFGFNSQGEMAWPCGSM